MQLGPQTTSPFFVAQSFDRLAALGAFFIATLAKAGGIDQGRFKAVFSPFGQHIGDKLGWYDG